MQEKIKERALPMLMSDDDAWVDVQAVRRLTSMSVSLIYEQLASGHFPEPVIRKPRFTRWRVGSIKDFMRRCEQAAAADSRAASELKARAATASAAAKAKRVAGAPT
ncbi:helix-turn-helix transcriptional regulator [Piscinibacter defluvii]|uniref:helix-turn-helix transcriptional regulator n=1 Tax=Piscinibacter defluvii TaxID=1796922 RepID=UPI0013E2B1BC|nr:hypothetical protein [Piscinibacter defluvii]